MYFLQIIILDRNRQRKIISSFDRFDRDAAGHSADWRTDNGSHILALSESGV